MIIKKYGMQVDLSQCVIDIDNEYSIKDDFLIEFLSDKCHLIFDHLYLCLDSELGNPAVAAKFDIGDDIDHYCYFDIILDKTDKYYLNLE